MDSNADRFAGGIEEERKLFYVAITRAKKFLFLTRSPGNTREKKVSEFMVEAKESPYMLGFDEKMVYTSDHIPPMSEDAAPLKNLLCMFMTISCMALPYTNAGTIGCTNP